MSADDRHNEGSRFRRPPTGPSVAPPRMRNDEPPARPAHPAGHGWRLLSIAVSIVLISGVGIRAYKDLSRPEAWAYWKDQYFSPSMTSSLIARADPAGSGAGRAALVVSGTIGPAAASWFREKLDEAHLAAGDTVLLSSPGGDLNQAVIMGEIIRSRGLVTAVGVADGSGHIGPSYCASACVLVYAGGKTRLGIDGSVLGVHRFVTSGTSAPGRDPVSETQQITAMILGYMTKMGVSSAVVQAMSETREIRWLGAREASAMNLVTAPGGRPSAPVPR